MRACAYFLRRRFVKIAQSINVSTSGSSFFAQPKRNVSWKHSFFRILQHRHNNLLSKGVSRIRQTVDRSGFSIFCHCLMIFKDVAEILLNSSYCHRIVCWLLPECGEICGWSLQRSIECYWIFRKFCRNPANSADIFWIHPSISWSCNKNIHQYYS